MTTKPAAAPLEPPAAAKVHSSRELLTFAIDLVSSFNSERVTPSTHCEQWTARNKVTDTGTLRFLESILFGIERRRDSASAICEHYYTAHRGKTERRDFTLYLVVLYLSVFFNASAPPTQQLEFKELRALILAADATKMVNFLTFVFEECLVSDFVLDTLSATLDAHYVETRIV